MLDDRVEGVCHRRETALAVTLKSGEFPPHAANVTEHLDQVRLQHPLFFWRNHQKSPAFPLTFPY
jgi:hypothetical protein